MKTISKYFVYGTKLQGLEQMMIVPNFIPRGSGIAIQNYFNCEGGVVDCNCCESNVRSRCCTDICFYFKEKLKVSKIQYTDLIKDCFGKMNNNALKIRLKLLSSNFKGELCFNHRHKERLDVICQISNLETHFSEWLTGKYSGITI